MPQSERDFELVRAPNPGPMTLEGTNSYVVGNDPAWVIDPGPDDPAHVVALEAAAQARGGLGGVLLTHSHADHSAVVDVLGAPLLWGRPSDAVEGSWSTEPTNPANGSLPQGFEAIPTPGHARDHTAFVRGDVCYCGDLVLGTGSSIVPPARFGGSLSDYLDSLRRLRDRDFALLAPGHGPLVTDPRAKIDEYLEHRAARERALAAALQAGERSRARLLELVWDDVPAVLRPAAAIAMQAHLEKLEAEGRISPGELAE